MPRIKAKPPAEVIDFRIKLYGLLQYKNWGFPPRPYQT